MPDFPLVITGAVVHSTDDLVDLLEKLGRHLVREHPLQVTPAESLIDDLRNPRKAHALAHAAAVLIERSDDPGVLQLCAHIGGHGNEAYYLALVMRLMAGNPIPDVAGMAEPSLVEELAVTLATNELGNHPYLHDLAIECLKERKLVRSALQVMAASDPNNTSADLLIEVLNRGSLDDRTATIVGLVIYRMAREDSDRLLEVAAVLADQPQPLRDLCMKRAEQGSTAAHTFDGLPAESTWWAVHGSALREILDGSDSS